MKAFDKLCKIFDKIAGIITVVLMIFITVIITLSVVFRSAGHPIQWSYEATLLCMSWTIFLGMVITFNPLKPKARNIWLLIMDLLVFAFLLYSAYLSIGVINTSMKTLYQTIPVSRGLFYLPYPIGCVFSACQIINVNYKRITAPAPAAGE